MSFPTIEVSNNRGKPRFLYEFSIGNKVWRYTSHDKSITVQGHLYNAVAISDDGVRQTGEAQADTMRIQMPFSEPVPQLFRVTPPINPITVKRMANHEGDSDMAVNYVGFVNQVSATMPGVADIECITLSPTMQRNGLRLSWQRGCPYSLYDSGTCKVNPGSYAVTIAVETSDAGVVTSPTLATYEDGWFSGGFIEWTDTFTEARERRGIDEHVGGQIRLLGKSDGIFEGAVLTVYPGCSRVADVCSSKFNNLSNYGGFPHLPGKSPFGGDPLY